MPTKYELFQQQRHRRFGAANPERLELEHWEWMVREKKNPYQAMTHFNAESIEPVDCPDWCFAQRFGMSSTKLSDGRTINIGGEYEDWYDPQFCIFNDVIVIDNCDNIEIYGYPRDEFPPTDFHTATLIGDRIILIGNLGYYDERTPGYTPVFSFDTQTYRMERLETAGENPGWIYEHLSALDPSGQRIIVRDGNVIRAQDADGAQAEQNVVSFELDLRNLNWRALPPNST